MKTYSSILLAFSIIFVFSCSKKNYGDESIYLTVLYDNPYDIDSPKKLTNQKVFIKDANSTYYLYEGLTDSEGSYTFHALKKDVDYEIYSNVTIDSIPYSGTVDFKAGERDTVTLNLTIDSSLNGFRIHCTDPDKAGIPGVGICIFQSQSLADSSDCDFSTFSIPSDTYYYSIIDTVSGYPINKQGTLVIADNGVLDTSITVIP